MEFDYGFEYAFPDAIEGAAEGAFVGAAGIFFGVFLILYLLMLALGVVSYVLQAVGLYRVTKRRGIHHAWLAWIPVGNTWLLGSVSDHYQYVAKQKITKRRKVLLILEIIMWVLIVAVIALIVALVITAENGGAMAGEIGITAVMTIAALALEGVSIAALVFCYIAYYDLFQSCRPNYSVLFLVLGIIFPVALPFFVFGCSGSDAGMPARRVQQPPVQIPYQPAAPQEPAEEAIPVVEAEIVEEPAAEPEEPQE